MSNPNMSITAPTSLHIATIEVPGEESSPDAIVASSSVFGSQNFDPDALTPDALLTYLSTRLNSLNDQTQSVLDRQKKSEAVRSEVNEIQKILSTLNTNEDDKGAPLELSDADFEALNDHIANIARVDEKLGARLLDAIGAEGQILHEDHKYTTEQLGHTKDYLNTVSKDIESGAQMDMINLQSLMGARQTAIQLSTNLVSALNESMKAVVTNIR